MQPKEGAAKRQIIEDQRSEHVYRIRWRVRRATAGSFLRTGISCTFSSMPSGTDSLNELGVASVSESRQGIVHVYAYLQLANAKSF